LSVIEPFPYEILGPVKGIPVGFRALQGFNVIGNATVSTPACITIARLANFKTTLLLTSNFNAYGGNVLMHFPIGQEIIDRGDVIITVDPPHPVTNLQCYWHEF
jgi:hypothetical protein